MTKKSPWISEPEPNAYYWMWAGSGDPVVAYIVGEERAGYAQTQTGLKKIESSYLFLKLQIDQKDIDLLPKEAA